MSRKAHPNSKQLNCAGVLKDVYNMNEAHNAVMISLANTYESTATTMDVHSEALEQTLKVKGKVTKKDLAVLHKSSKAYRKAGRETKKMIKNYNQSADRLISQVQKCLQIKIKKSKKSGRVARR